MFFSGGLYSLSSSSIPFSIPPSPRLPGPCTKPTESVTRQEPLRQARMATLLSAAPRSLLSLSSCSVLLSLLVHKPSCASSLEPPSDGRISITTSPRLLGPVRRTDGIYHAPGAAAPSSDAYVVCCAAFTAQESSVLCAIDRIHRTQDKNRSAKLRRPRCCLLCRVHHAGELGPMRRADRIHAQAGSCRIELGSPRRCLLSHIHRMGELGLVP